jgi:predicted phosphodiesterase
MSRLVLLGDLHGDPGPLDRLGDAGAAVLVGDLGLAEPFPQLAERAGTVLRYVPGNHDADADVFHDALLGAAPEASLHARVETLAGVRVAGLGGVFRGAVWLPPAPPVFRDRLAHLASLAPERALGERAERRRWRGGLPRRHRVSIYPEDLEALAGLRAEVLVTHEGPASPALVGRRGEAMGFAVLEEVARRIGARWIVHGHHHRSYEADLGGGLRARGLAIGEAWRLP